MKTMTPKAVARAFAIAIALGGLACEKKVAPSEQASPTAGSKAEGPTPSGALSPQAKEGLTKVLDAYESIRAELARDDIAATTASAERLENAVKEAQGNVPENLRPQVQKAAAAAGQLRATPKQNANDVRRSFGQVSEAMVALVAAAPSLQEGHHIFECPMAQGYKKWIQVTAKISNPYMGTAMLECGSPSKWDG